LHREKPSLTATFHHQHQQRGAGGIEWLPLTADDAVDQQRDEDRRAGKVSLDVGVMRMIRLSTRSQAEI
jgi:hypothetical protein